MIDKITISAHLSGEECAALAQMHRLKCWVNSDVSQVEYRSSDYSNITGIDVRITNNTVKLSTSLHKFWQMRNLGKLRNDNGFTMLEAKLAAEMFLKENKLNPNKTYVSYYEIGLNLQVNYDPLSFIELANYISNSKEKEMFIDANYRKNRQRTTAKHKDIRKYFKIYDKGWQIQEKDKVPIDSRNNSLRILRIETCHKRYKKKWNEFFSDKNLNVQSSRFYIEWSGLNFSKNVSGVKGTRSSELERAKIIVNFGKDFLTSKNENDFKMGDLSKPQYRTVREFIRDFEKLKYKFKIIVPEQENDYNNLLFKTFKSARE